MIDGLFDELLEEKESSFGMIDLQVPR